MGYAPLFFLPLIKLLCKIAPEGTAKANPYKWNAGRRHAVRARVNESPADLC